MLTEFIIRIQTIALDINPILLIAINEKNNDVINEQSFKIDLVFLFRRGLFSVSAGANNIVAIIDIEQVIAINIRLKL